MNYKKQKKKKPDYFVRLMLLGEANVGKTSIL